MSAAGDVIAAMETLTLVPRGPFSLAASIAFLEGFTPAAYSSPAGQALELAFGVEGSWPHVGLPVRQDDDCPDVAQVGGPGRTRRAARRGPAARDAARGGTGRPEEAAGDRGFLRRAHLAARRGLPRRRAQRRAAAGPRGRAGLRAARPGHPRADPGHQRELAALPHLGHAAAADPAGVRGNSAGLRWG